MDFLRLNKQSRSAGVPENKSSIVPPVDNTQLQKETLPERAYFEKEAAAKIQRLMNKDYAEELRKIEKRVRQEKEGTDPAPARPDLVHLLPPSDLIAIVARETGDQTSGSVYQIARVKNQMKRSVRYLSGSPKTTAIGRKGIISFF